MCDLVYVCECACVYEGGRRSKFPQENKKGECRGKRGHEHSLCERERERGSAHYILHYHTPSLSLSHTHTHAHTHTHYSVKSDEVYWRKWFLTRSQLR